MFEKLIAINEAKANWEKAFMTNDNAAMESAESSLKDAEAAYADAVKEAHFETLRKESNPIMAAVLSPEYEVYSHKIDREDGHTVGISISVRRRMMNIADFFKYMKMANTWSVKAEKLAYMLTLRTAKQLGESDEKIEQIASEYKMSSAAIAIKMDITDADGVSNNKLTAAIQEIIDAMLMIPGADGKNTLKANSHDAMFMVSGFTKQGGLTSVRVGKAKTVESLITSVIHRIATGKVYDVNGYPVNKETKSAQKQANEAAQKQMQADFSKAVKAAEKKVKKDAEVSAPAEKPAKGKKKAAAPAEQTAEVEKIA